MPPPAPPPARIGPSQPKQEPETSAAEVSMTGTDGARILPFSLATKPEYDQSSSARSLAERDQSSCARTSPGIIQSSSARTFPANKASVGFLGISHGRVWRPKVYVRNPKYPRVTAVGCYFVEHSGGYQLIHTNSSKYLGHYTMAAISELEKKYAKKKRNSRNRKRK
jgi:hypothetical protein